MNFILVQANQLPNSNNANENYQMAASNVFTSGYMASSSSATSSLMMDSAKYDKLFQYYTENDTSTFDQNAHSLLSQNTNIYTPGMQSNGYASSINSNMSAASYNYNHSFKPPANGQLKLKSNTSSSELNAENMKKPMNQVVNSYTNFSGNFPFPTLSSSIANNSELGMQQVQQPTSTPRFNSFDKNNLNKNNFDSNDLKCSNNRDDEGDSSDEDSESDDNEDADSESDLSDLKQRLAGTDAKKMQQKYQDDDEEIWLFRKPQTNVNNFDSSNKPTEFRNNYQQPQQQQSETNIQQKQKQRKRLERQKNREQQEKDFSDQDEIDRDVTTVLDIAKLKRLPKLL